MRVSTLRSGAPLERRGRVAKRRDRAEVIRDEMDGGVLELTKQTLPSAPIGASATFGSTLPRPKLTFDATGGVMPRQTKQAARCQAPPASTGVRFTTATSPG